MDSRRSRYIQWPSHVMPHGTHKPSDCKNILLLLLNKTAESSTWCKVVVTTEEEISLILYTKAILA